MNKRIFISDWLELKPYKKQVKTDIYYLNICNQVKNKIVNSDQFATLSTYLNPSGVNLVSCFLTSYFEDLISETNLWNSFISVHTRLYNKSLPFYELDDYYEKEVNYQDVCFLIWYFLNTLQEDHFISPYNESIFDAASEVTHLLLDHWEYAPENEDLVSYYRLDENEIDYYNARGMIDTLLFKSYLFVIDSGLLLSESEEEIYEEHGYSEHLPLFLNSNRDVMLHRTHTRLLSLMGKEWVAEILGKDHPLSVDFLNMSPKIDGYFLYKGQNETDIFLEHIASGKKFNMTKKSFDHSDSLQEIDTIVFIGIIRWREEWWFSGSFSPMRYNADLILDEKNSIPSRVQVNFLDYSHAENSLIQQEKAFLEYNKGSSITFLTADKVNDFMNGFMQHMNDSLNLSEVENKEANENLRKDGFLKESTPLDLTDKDESETALVYFNPKSGCEIGFGVSSAFPLSENPHFEEELSYEHFLRLLKDPSISSELALFCLDQCKENLAILKTDPLQQYLDDIDFLLRFWKKENYHTVPAISFIGQQE